MNYIGKINKEILGEYRKKIITDRVIITNERIEHIKKRHLDDYERYIKYIPDVLYNPDYILEDRENKDTILMLKKIEKQDKKIQVVVKLQTNLKEKEKSNSILTFWHIRDRSYRSTIKNNKMIYKKLDREE